MAWVEKRGERFRIAFRFDGRKKYVSLNSDDRRDAEICLSRFEDNLRLVERGRLKRLPSGDVTEVGLQ